VNPISANTSFILEHKPSLSKAFFGMNDKLSYLHLHSKDEANN
jgi:hypothetical protein